MPINSELPLMGIVAAALVGVLAACSNTETDSVFSSGISSGRAPGTCRAIIA